MPSTFPTSIDVFDPHPPVDGFDFVMADHVGQLQDAVTAVETALGEGMQNVDPPQRIHSATTAATPADADEFGYVESSSFELRKLTWGNIKTVLDTLYKWATITHAATAKTTPVDADELSITDSAAGYAIKKLTWGNIKTVLNALYKWDTVTHAATAKTAPADADELSITDSAASYVTKKLTWGNIKAALNALYNNQDLSYINGLKLSYTSYNSITVGTGMCYSQAGDLIDVTSPITQTLVSSANTFFHVYIYKSGASIVVDFSTTAPNSPYKGTARSKIGNTSMRYLGTILTNSVGDIKNFTHNPSTNYFAYQKFQANASPHRVLSGGTAATATSVSLTGIIPSTSSLAYVRITNTSDRNISTSEDNGVSISSQMTVFLTAGNSAQQTAFLIHNVDSSRNIWYLLASAPSTGGLYIDVLGYFCER